MNKIGNIIVRTVRKSNSTKNYYTLLSTNRQYSYKSDISLDKLYPTSKLNLFTPPPPTVSDNIYLSKNSYSNNSSIPE